MHNIVSPSFPTSRPRRLRSSSFIRELVQETRLSVKDLVAPIFILEGPDEKESVESMPGIDRIGINLAIKEAKNLYSLGVPAIALFPVTPTHLKSATGEESFNPDGLTQRAISQIKNAVPEIGIIADVALDPFTTHGHDGVINDEGIILNDRTIEILCQQAQSLARSGVDVVAPSDMMDGRVGAIRSALDSESFSDTKILAYSAKYASAFYGPFRDAVGSAAKLGKGSKKTYQMDPNNSSEAIREVFLDLSEGADMVMVKPGMPYLDILYRVKMEFGAPTFAYQVSGEYSMLKIAVANGLIEEQQIVLETLGSFKRAGADGILSYFTPKTAVWLNENP